MSKKRLREKPAVDTQLAEIYEDLANVDESIRLKAAQSLISSFVLRKETTSDHLHQILNRLFRGLCSGRKAARLGFSVALTISLEVLFPSSGERSSNLQNVEEIIDLLKSNTQVAASAHGQVGIVLLEC